MCLLYCILNHNKFDKNYQSRLTASKTLTSPDEKEMLLYFFALCLVCMLVPASGCPIPAPLFQQRT
jgi:hypothetical protein